MNFVDLTSGCPSGRRYSGGITVVEGEFVGSESGCAEYSVSDGVSCVPFGIAAIGAIFYCGTVEFELVAKEKLSLLLGDKAKNDARKLTLRLPAE